MHLDESPFALTDHIVSAEVGTTTVGAIAANVLVVAGIAGLTIYGLRKLLQGATGKSA